MCASGPGVERGALATGIGRTVASATAKAYESQAYAAGSSRTAGGGFSRSRTGSVMAFEYFAVAAPIAGGDGDVADDQKLLRDHRQDLFH